MISLSRSGEILEGDVVLAVDNKSIDNLHISEIKSILKDLRDDYSMKIQFNVNKPGKIQFLIESAELLDFQAT